MLAKLSIVGISIVSLFFANNIAHAKCGFREIIVQGCVSGEKLTGGVDNIRIAIFLDDEEVGKTVTLDRNNQFTVTVYHNTFRKSIITDFGVDDICDYFTPSSITVVLLNYSGRTIRNKFNIRDLDFKDSDTILTLPCQPSISNQCH